MLGKAGEIKISDALKDSGSVRNWLMEHQDMLVLDIKATETEGNDYFYIIYKEPNQ
ncbi:hypothetical protein J2T12_005072 [Paenibacillus anaericanus]|uniref:hypothetical protein n=1 Tax=Paenibacillus anaericanus TaxID=170367 RepID=UPI002789A1ED|nr:hypothetical protein [Paenibacillus anaericanus]MDQ0091632.1 hypothetical protein [Paenibacillus anaericanus]